MVTVTHFKHYVLALSHRHGTLVTVQALLALANTAANSFALIYLVEKGLGYVECAVFILVCATVPLALVAFASRTIVRNFSASITTAFVCLALYYSSLIVIGEELGGWYLVLIPPVFFGTYIVTFWVPYNALIMHITSKKKRGAVIGAYFLIFPLVSTVGPLLGGVIITLFSYDALFAVGAVVVLFNLFFVSGFRVLRQLKERIIIPELIQSLKLNITGRLHIDLDFRSVGWRLRYALFAEGIQDGIFWIAIPLLSFEFAGSEIGLSGYLSLFAFWGAVMTVLLGYLSDRIRDRTNIVRIGATFAAVSILVAANSPFAAGYVSAMSFAYLWIAIVPSFLFTMLLDKMERWKKKGVLVREFLLNAGRVLGVAATILVLVMDLDLAVALGLAGVATATIVIVD
jgi:MFS family permease